jgi:hypothetical protein
MEMFSASERAARIWVNCKNGDVTATHELPPQLNFGNLKTKLLDDWKKL